MSLRHRIRRAPGAGTQANAAYRPEGGVEYLWANSVEVGRWYYDSEELTVPGVGDATYSVEGHFIIDGVTHATHYEGTAPQATMDQVIQDAIAAQVNADGYALAVAAGLTPVFTTFPNTDEDDWPPTPYPASPLNRYWIREMENWPDDLYVIPGRWRLERLTLDPYETGDGFERLSGSTYVGRPQRAARARLERSRVRPG